jgi:hypothetical protein
MKGKKIGVLIGVLSVLMPMLAMNTSAAIAHEVTATPATVAWGDTVYISFYVSPNSTGTWVGNAYCNLTSPTGTVVHLGAVALNVASTELTYYANWSYIPDEVGTWTVAIDMVKTSGTLTILDHSTTFEQERTMVSVTRNINAWSAVLLYLVVGILLIALLVIMVSKVTGRTGKKE